jgi:hypothetical protein
VAHHVLHLVALLEEVAVAEVIEADVVGHLGGVGAVDGHAPLVAVVDGRVAEELPRRVADEVPVERVLAEHPELAAERELDAVDVGGAAGPDHHAGAAPGPIEGGAIAGRRDHDVAGEVRDLRALIDHRAPRALDVLLGERAVVVGERLGHGHGPPVGRHRGHRALLGLGEVEAGRPERQPIADLPADRLLERDRGGAGADLGRDPLPAEVGRAVAEHPQGAAGLDRDRRRGPAAVDVAALDGAGVAQQEPDRPVVALRLAAALEQRAGAADGDRGGGDGDRLGQARLAVQLAVHGQVADGVRAVDIERLVGGDGVVDQALGPEQV